MPDANLGIRRFHPIKPGMDLVHCVEPDADAITLAATKAYKNETFRGSQVPEK